MKLAQDYTKLLNIEGSSDNGTAIQEFIKVMQDQTMYFNDKPFPDNETGKEAFIKCYDNPSAEAYCPKRYKAMQAWIKNSREASNFG